MGVEIDNLRAFCEVLETTIAGLTDVSGDLEEQADEHESLHDDMRQLLEKMHSEGGRIDEEADQAGPAVLNEVQELAEAVRGAHDTRLPAIQKDAHETSERFHEALAPRAAALQEGAEELEEQGFAPRSPSSSASGPTSRPGRRRARTRWAPSWIRSSRPPRTSTPNSARWGTTRTPRPSRSSSSRSWPRPRSMTCRHATTARATSSRITCAKS